MSLCYIWQHWVTSCVVWSCLGPQQSSSAHCLRDAGTRGHRLTVELLLSRQRQTNTSLQQQHCTLSLSSVPFQDFSLDSLFVQLTLIFWFFLDRPFAFKQEEFMCNKSPVIMKLFWNISPLQKTLVEIRFQFHFIE